jgi:pantoate--beta-alanine ligase
VKNNFKSGKIDKLKRNIYNNFKSIPLLKLEYLEIRENITLKPIKKINKKNKCRAFIAVIVGKIRLIDNIELSLI